MKKLIIFDICNTFVDTNSTFSYVDYLISKGIKSGYKVFFHNRILGYFYTILYLLFGFDTKIYLTKRYFKGLNVDDIKILSQEYFKRYESKIFPRMIDIINKEKSSGKVIFLSSSINPPIDFLKNKFGVDGFSSKLEEIDGKYTGKVLQPLWGRKQTIFEKGEIDLNAYEEIEFYTDNIDDSGLIKYLDEHHDNVNIFIIPYKNKKYWNKFFSTNKIHHEFMD